MLPLFSTTAAQAWSAPLSQLAEIVDVRTRVRQRADAMVVQTPQTSQSVFDTVTGMFILRGR